MKMAELTERLRYLMREEGLKQKDLAEMIGTSPQTVNNWLKRGSLSRESAQAINEKTGYSLDWLLNGTGHPKPESSNFRRSRLHVAEWESIDNNDDEFVEVPLLGVRLSAGGGAYDVDEDEVYALPFRSQTLRRLGIRVDNARVVTVMGDSMEPRLSDGNKVAVNLSDKEIRDGKMYAIRMGELQRVKALIRRPDGGVTVRSYNPAYEDEIVTRKQMVNGDLVVIGRVWWVSALV
ncbi:helix-turn-helix transcriptional regulator [Affinibrenneria salicis]|uniref:Helix-turn-helix transcriptional regulator n=1 Tax=Affinibrenneria salicis TaxID=2590031 RepID=A0A5J5G1V3_9GAMM|nr:helix-turn-helix transcriptional regulator [Affinibrenneria salicis]KAA9000638.1 helix-turn-helix transcriptional regulator [Affinibrenneria salicis]